MLSLSLRLMFGTALGAVVLLSQAPGTISTVAGSGAQGYSGDGEAATLARLNVPVWVAVGFDGSLYIADQFNNRIRKVTPDGIIRTIAGTGTPGFAGDGGLATAAQLTAPTGVALDSAGNVFIADEGNKRIRKVDSAGKITTVAGTGNPGYGGDGLPALQASFANPVRVAVDNSGNLYVADQYANRVRKIVNGVITTFAGNGQASFSGDGGLATEAALNNPTAIFPDSFGNLWISDQFNHRIRKVNSDNIISTAVGNGSVGFAGDGGAPTLASLNYPGGLLVDGAGTLFFSDDQNFRIRKLSSNNVVSTVAGNGSPGFFSDNGPALNAPLNGQFGVALDAAGNLYIADSLNNRIRKVTGVAASSLPAFTGTSITNAASFAIGATPGGLVTIFGTNLSYGLTGIAITDKSPWETTLAGTSVLVDGTPAPVYSVVKAAQEQVSFQVPYESASKRSVDIVVRTAAGSSNPQTIALLAVQPGVFHSFDAFNTCACLHNADFKLITQDNAAVKDEYVAMFVTGLGQVSNPPATGAPALASPLSWANVVPSVTVGGVHAGATFYGLAPYFTGLYQINFQVPAGLPSGLADVIVTSSGIASNASKLYIK